MDRFFLFFTIFLLTSCGGGGGGGGSNNASSPSPTTYSINGQLYGSSLSTLSAYSDSNFSGAVDNGELSDNVSSDGSFALSTTNQNLYNCLQGMPLAAESSSDYFFSPNLDNSNESVVLNPFVSIFSDFIYPTFFWDHPAVDGIDCSTLNEIRNGMLNRNTNKAITVIRKFDGFKYNDLLINPSNPITGNPIDNTRTADLQKFWQSLKSIEGIILNEFKAVLLDSEYSNANISSRIELDESIMRVFLNDTSYPNPYTDLSPIANSIDSIALPAGMDLIVSLDNAVGSWRDTLKITLWDVHISNNGDLLLDETACWINFSNLCKLEPTISNILTNYEPEINSFFYKETSRGHETIEHTEVILDSNSAECYVINKSQIAEVKQSSIVTRSYNKYYSDGYYSGTDLDCNAWNNIGNSLEMIEINTSGEEIILQIYQSGGDSYSSVKFQQIANDHVTYDDIDDGTIIEQIPSSIASVLNDLKLDWESIKILADSDFNEPYIYFNLYYWDSRLNYIRLLYYPYDQWAICESPTKLNTFDGAIASRTDLGVMFGDFSLEDVISQCIADIEFGSELIGEERDLDFIKNLSPYRGEIND